MTNGDGKFTWKDSVSLKDYFDEKLKALKESMDLRYEGLREAMSLAKTGMDERLARMNEFRDALRDQNATFMTKCELKSLAEKFDAQFERINTDIRELREFRAELKGKAEQSSVNLSLAIAVVGLIIGIIGIISRFIHM